MPLKNLEPLQMIVFPYKEEVESSYLTLNSNYNWDLKKERLLFTCFLRLPLLGRS